MCEIRFCGWGLGVAARPAGVGVVLQGHLAHEKQPPQKDHHRTLGIFLLWGPRKWVFLISEVTGPSPEPRELCMLPRGMQRGPEPPHICLQAVFCLQ